MNVSVDALAVILPALAARSVLCVVATTEVEQCSQHPIPRFSSPTVLVFFVTKIEKIRAQKGSVGQSRAAVAYRKHIECCNSARGQKSMVGSSALASFGASHRLVRRYCFESRPREAPYERSGASITTLGSESHHV